MKSYKCPVCEMPAFFVLNDPVAGDYPMVSDVRKVDGTQPHPGEPIKCGSCGAGIGRLDMEQLVPA